MLSFDQAGWLDGCSRLGRHQKAILAVDERSRFGKPTVLIVQAGHRDMHPLIELKNRRGREVTVIVFAKVDKRIIVRVQENAIVATTARVLADDSVVSGRRFVQSDPCRQGDPRLAGESV